MRWSWKCFFGFHKPVVDTEGDGYIASHCEWCGEEWLEATPPPVISELMLSTLKSIEEDYNHPWPNEDERTKQHRLKLLELVRKLQKL